MLCVLRERSLRRADHSYRGVIPSVACLSVIMQPRLGGGPGPLGGCRDIKYIHTNTMARKLEVIQGACLKRKNVSSREMRTGSVHGRDLFLWPQYRLHRLQPRQNPSPIRQ
jgi:hypothetical protein